MELGIGSNSAKIRNRGDSKLGGRTRGERSLRNIFLLHASFRAMAMGRIISADLKAGSR